ncbi:alanine dehydrogenase [Klugiella xanthotipulae]|uniref:Alanine dehydrogenase n=1 Tax=Klugiella xanthotipulae TaxID=244735 RepID=A0A543I6L3_9MICO|nr:alanine dehydrogenase [Klugiella xanthotipulae]TQM66199.1 alanine dehydrogenase [Klugiella xanthotipulae]
MRIGVPSEVKNHEYRVAITPAGVHELVRNGHDVTVQTGAGLGSGITDDDYTSAGATLGTVDEVWAGADLIVKVKEPIASEYARLRSDQVLFTYLHLAADRPLTQTLIDQKVTAIAYETVQTTDRALPLLAPMSEIAGRLAVHAGIYHLQRSQGGSGILASGVPGVEPAKVLVIGGGAAGENAIRQAMGIGAKVTVLDVSIPRLRELDRQYPGLTTLASTAYALEREARQTDLIIGAVLIPGARAPKLVSSELVAQLKPGTVLVDIAIDQGGCFADSRPTTHDNPTYSVGQSTFYCVANMPGAVSRTSTLALTNVTLPYLVAIANKGWQGALRDDEALARGLNTSNGSLTNADVAQSFPDMPVTDIAAALS